MTGRPSRSSLDSVWSAVQFIDSPVVLVGIDGMSAAGKSTFARLLAHASDGVVVAGDDFYRVMDEHERFGLSPQEGVALDYDWERLAREVLAPLRSSGGVRSRLRRLVAGRH